MPEETDLLPVHPVIPVEQAARQAVPAPERLHGDLADHGGIPFPAAVQGRGDPAGLFANDQHLSVPDGGLQLFLIRKESIQRIEATVQRTLRDAARAGVIPAAAF